MRETYTFEEAYAATVDYFGGDEIAADVWTNKYALRDDVGRYLERTPTDMHRRLAVEFARIEERYPNPMSEDEVFELLDRFKYIVPQGSPMAAVGNPYKVQSLSNCFVIDGPHDSYGGIMYTDQEQAQIMKRRGGVGFDISRIRPRGLPTKNAAHTTDGIGIFMERFSNTCREVAQGGRRGALMLTVSCHHPQLRTFIDIKRDLKRVTGANISIRMTDEFMDAVKNDKKVQLRWPIDPDVEHNVEVWEDARKLWDDVVSSARDCSEPGLLFWDAVTRRTPADAYASVGYRTVSTNPCGELPLSVGDSCRLIVVNLSGFVSNPFTPAANFDWDKMAYVVSRGQRLMDDLVDLELEAVDAIIEKIDADPEPDHVKRVERDLWCNIRDRAHCGRRTGLGVTAVGDVVAMMGMKYGSDESVEFVERLYKALCLNSYKSSIEMAEERGSFPVYCRELERGHEFLDQVYDALPPGWQKRWDATGRRNIANTTTAPCGSVSICTQTTSGIEPPIFLKYTRKKKVNPDDEGVRVDSVDDMGDSWMHFILAHHGVMDWIRTTRDDDAAQEWLESDGEEGIEDSPYWGATAMDLDPTSRLRLQAAAQRWVCHAISSTVNLPKDVPIESVKELYTLGHRLECKGITIYRDGSRSGVLIKDDKGEVLFEDHHAPKRPDALKCHIHRATIKGEEWTMFVGLMDGRPYEVFGGLSELVEIPKKFGEGRIVKRSFKQGGKYDVYYGDEDDPHKVKDIVKVFDNPNYSAFTRLLSLSLRHGAPIQYIVEQLQRDKEQDLFSFAKVMARVLKRYITDGTRASASCWECGTEGSLYYQEGCVSCASCGASRCG